MKVSVIMGTHNGETTVRRAIQSIQRQTMGDWEFIICDDCSTDDTWTILQSMATADPRIQLIRNHEQTGLSIGLNQCLALATAPLIARMDDDDVSQPQRLELQIKALRDHPEVALVGSNARLFSQPGSYDGVRKCPAHPEANEIFGGRNFIHPTVLIRRDALIKVGGYTIAPYVLRCEDFDLWCKLYANGYVGMNLQQPLLDYHESYSSIKNRNAQQHKNVHQVMKLWVDYLPLTTKERLHIFVPLIKSWLPQPILNLRYRKLLAQPKSEVNHD